MVYLLYVSLRAVCEQESHGKGNKKHPPTDNDKDTLPLTVQQQFQLSSTATERQTRSTHEEQDNTETNTVKMENSFKYLLAVGIG